MLEPRTRARATTWSWPGRAAPEPPRRCCSPARACASWSWSAASTARDTLSTHALMRGAVVQLARLGPARRGRGGGDARRAQHVVPLRGAGGPRPDQGARRGRGARWRPGAPCSTACWSTRREPREPRSSTACACPTSSAAATAASRASRSRTATAARSASSPTSWSGPTACARPWRGSPGPRCTRPAATRAASSTGTSTGSRTTATTGTSAPARASGGSRRTTASPASSPRRPPAASATSSAGTSRPASIACWPRWPRSWPRRSRTCPAPGTCAASPASPASCAGPSAPASRSWATPPTSRTRSPPTASPTRCATLRFSPTRCCEGSQAAFVRYQELRDALGHGIFELSDRIASFEWSLPALEQMHLALSEEMKREVAALGERHAAQDVPARRSA